MWILSGWVDKGFRTVQWFAQGHQKLQLYSSARVPSVTISMHYLNDHTSQTIRCLAVPPTSSKSGRQVEHCPETQNTETSLARWFPWRTCFHKVKASQFKLWQILTYFATQNRNHKRNTPHFTEQHTWDLKSSFLNSRILTGCYTVLSKVTMINTTQPQTKWNTTNLAKTVILLTTQC